MTVKYHCDAPDCDRQMGRDEARLAITVEEAPTPPFDPAQLEDGEYPMIETEFSIYSDGDFHFCSDPCLTSWAMIRALDGAD